MKKHDWLLAGIACIALLFAGCAGGGTDADDSGDDDDDDTTSPTVSTVAVDAGYAYVADPTDEDSPEVLSMLPNTGATDVSPAAPIVMYFDDMIDPASVNDTSIQVFEGSGAAQENYRAADAKQVYGTITISKTANGLVTIIVFTPFDSFSPNVTVTVTIDETVVDNGGNPLETDDPVTFTTGTQEATSASVLDFEAGDEGLSFNGQGGIVELPKWGMPLMEGTHAAAITTGDVEDFTNSPIDGQYSVFSTGLVSVPSGMKNLTLDYYFVSDEFKDYLGTKYDDNATVTVSGSGGARTVVLNSVNSYDSVEGEAQLTEVSELGDWWTTPKTTKSIDISDLGDEVTISITISDVGDTIFGSMLLFDDLRFE